MKKSAIVAGVTATMLAFGAFAADGGKAAKFESLDKNADGRITPSEASSHQQLSSGFATADANADGGLTKAEFNAWHSQKGGSGSMERDSGSMDRDTTRTPPGMPQSQSTTEPDSPTPTP